MKKEKLQPKNSEKQGLEMARQSLRRAKEMDLTPKEKEKVMSMIREAKAAEKVGKKVEAFNLYVELKNYLESTKLKPEDSPEKTRKQRMILQEQIDKIKKSFSGNPLEKEEILKELIWQQRFLESPVYANLVSPEKDNNIIEQVNFLKESHVFQMIERLEGLDSNDLFVISKIQDWEGNIVSLDLALLGKPVRYSYSLQGNWDYRIFSGTSIGIAKTCIKKITVKNKQIIGETEIASFDRDDLVWKVL